MTGIAHPRVSESGVENAGYGYYALPPEVNIQSYGEKPTIEVGLAGCLFLVSLTFTFSKSLYWIPQIFAAAWFVVLVVRGLAIPSRRFLFPKPLVVYALWVVWSGLGVITAEMFNLAIADWAMVVRMLGLAFLACNSIRSLRQLRFLLFLFLLGELAAAIMGHIQMGDLAVMRRWEWHEVRRDVMYGISNANDLGRLGFVGITSSIFLFLTAQKGCFWQRVFSAAGVVLSLYVIWASGSRREMINVPLLLILLFFLHVIRGRRITFSQKAAMAAMVFVLFIGSMVWVVYSPYSHRLGSFAKALLGDVSELKQESRFKLIYIVKDAVSEKPLFGHGLGHFRLFSYRHSVFRGQSAHSDIGAVVAETGIIGLLIYLLWYVFWCGKIRSLRKQVLPRHHETMVNSIWVFTVLVILNAPTSEFYRDKFIWTITGAFMGYCLNLQRLLSIQEQVHQDQMCQAAIAADAQPAAR